MRSVREATRESQGRSGEGAGEAESSGSVREEWMWQHTSVLLFWAELPRAVVREPALRGCGSEGAGAGRRPPFQEAWQDVDMGECTLARPPG